MTAVATVLDTNVLVAGLRSRRGASFQLLQLVGASDAFHICLSVPLVLEYEAVVKRQARELGLKLGEVDSVLDYLCSVAAMHEVFFLWRPVLRDPRDDFVLELAVSAGCETIVTFNQRDFAGAEAFGIGIERPREFMKRIGVT